MIPAVIVAAGVATFTVLAVRADAGRAGSPDSPDAVHVITSAPDARGGAL